MHGELTTISNVCQQYGLSTRTLRYWEQVGLIQSCRMPDYAYRVYDEEALRRVRQIIVLRKLRIPLGVIGRILADGGAAAAVDAFLARVRELDEESDAIATIRAILVALVGRLREGAHSDRDRKLLGRVLELDAVDALSISKISLKEDTNMDKLNEASERLSTLTDVRIVHLPPCTVASAHYIGENPEDNSGKMLHAFIREHKLYERKPDARIFGFNHPSPTQEQPIYGYEFWVTVPDDMDVPAPLTKQRFEGGLYAAHMIPIGNFHEWDWLVKWIAQSAIYTHNDLCDGGERMGGLMEEAIGEVYYTTFGRPEGAPMQLDLLFPIRLK